MRKGLSKSIAAKISLLLVGMMILCALTVGVSSLILYRKNAVDANAERALHIAESAAAMIDGDAFTVTMETLETDEYYDLVKHSLDEIRRRTGVEYLYVLDAKYDTHMTYYAEGYDGATDDEEEVLLGDREALVIDGEDVYAPELFSVLQDGLARATGTYDSGDFGKMVSGFAPVSNAAGAIVGVVGVDVGIDQVMDEVAYFTVRIVLIILAFCLVLGAVCVLWMRRMIGRPLGLLTRASDQMAQGDVSIRLGLSRGDEIGVLADSFDKMAANIREQVAVLEQLAQGDLSVQTAPRSEVDAMGAAMVEMLENLNRMFDEIKTSAGQVSLGSKQISQAAQALAAGSTEQAAAVQQYTSSISLVLEKSKENAGQAREAYQDAQKTGELMLESIHSMDRMLEAMGRISESSERIGKVIKVIDDIAFQTNILALNAAVEAAHAGVHGQGFAVVAEEVRSLATKSAQAARETAALIEDSIQRIHEGNDIVGKTNSILQSVAGLADSNGASMNAISEASGWQSETIDELTRGMEQISSVVQQNSATAEQSAASAQEMAAQAHMLDDIVARFTLKNQTPLLTQSRGYEWETDTAFNPQLTHTNG